jgi:hypothetical protein
MALPTLDPHPLGCPLGLALTPEEMQPAVIRLCVKLRDLIFPTVHVVNPSRGRSYPMLNLHTHRGSETPRLVIFPGWEDDKRERRLDWKRQATLMKRIRDAGVEGETLDLGDKEADDREPAEFSLACTAAQMDGAIHDLNDYFGDVVRITISTVKQQSKSDLKVIRLYAPNAEAAPRLVFYPGWTGDTEEPAARISDEIRPKVRARADRTAEVPIEIYLSKR